MRCLRAGRDHDGPTVVIVADPPNGIEHVVPLVDRVATRYPVVALEPLGFGWSPVEPSFDWSLDAYIDALGDALRTLDLDRVVLAAPCVFGIPAVCLAARDPLRIRALVLSQTASWPATLTWLERVDHKRQLRRPLLGQIAVRVRERDIIGRWYRAAEPDVARVESYTETARGRSRSGAPFCIASAFQAMDRAGDLDPLAEVHVHPPTAILWGLEDRSHPEDHAESMLRAMPSATLIPVEGAGHFPELSMPDLFLDTVTGLLAGSKDTLVGGKATATKDALPR